MRQQNIFQFLIAAFVLTAVTATGASVFEGRIRAVTTQGESAMPVLYMVGTNFLRVEMTDTNWPNPVDILDRNSGTLTLLFPHNRSFVRLKPATENSSTPFQFGFTNAPGATFAALATTNVSLSLSNWILLGGVAEISPGQFRFTDLNATNGPRRFYRVRSL